MYEKRINNPGKNMIGIILIVLVLLSGSAFVPLGVALDVSNPMMKVSWRVTNMIPFLGVLGIIQAAKSRYYKMMSIFEKDTFSSICIAAFAIAGQQYCAIFAG